ncbi:MAG: GDP-fucose synthetase [Bacteroidetes bacterium GWF2_49_14]|nr:MAG: GDP-fucose synthetase [Bacteroidetes bacterium GWF2_49_14]
MERKSKIYVAGHKGLVGSAIWRNLEGKGYANLIGRTFEELDLRNQAAVEAFFASEKPEYVILAAAKVGGIMANNTYRGEFIYENLMVQNNVIHQAYVHGVKKLLFLGSTCIYPKECPQPMKEEYLLTGPLEQTNEPYAIAKIAGIKMCESYNIQYGTNFISVMPTNLYGPNDNFDLEKSHVLPALLRKIHLGKLLEEGEFDAIARDVEVVEIVEGVEMVEEVKRALARVGVKRTDDGGLTTDDEGRTAVIGHRSSVAVEIWGSGTPMREFMWSEDMADACVFLMETDDGRRTTDGGHQSAVIDRVNIGTGKEISIRDLAYLIKDIVGFRGEVVFNSSKPDGTMRKVTDVSKLHSLGWSHKVELAEGIRRVYDWYLKNKST